ncbi:N-acetylglucosamine-6-phosphate deacetylase [Irregularibacter muris]|uniref:N-acetylglucosamine-6-phosphate deacetylase n=1 Tax=Irregularibacter muris TaxID=1796619 RepID=A0AAE3HDR7_9FIRM|nr:N-acetylglucosamine-6-phosphate deacetylase [Irregularibacter muris]MCR1898256.1 N-acetylglucosamine-6-phosphate deacetylase [Irregularibacter muris]
MFLYSENIYTPEGFQKGYLNIEHGKIKGIVQEVDEKEDVVDYTNGIIIPGFIDMHIHGWATGSFKFQGDKKALQNMSKGLVKVGVTSYLASTATNAVEKLKKQASDAREFMEEWIPEKGSQVLGIHLEGPFINKEYKGMQKEEYCIDPSIEITESLLESAGEGNVKLMTLAPELPNADRVITYLHEKGIQVSIGHSAAEFEDIARVKDLGVGGFTHTFSGMRGFHHRRLGVVGAAMYFEDMYAEFSKQTGMTVKPEAFAIVYRLKGPEKIILSTDCTGLAQVKEPFYHYIRKCTFSPYGEDSLKCVYDDGREEIINKYEYDNVKDVELSYLGSIQNVVKNVKASVSDIVKMTSENPAKYLGVDSYKGSIEAGKDADVIIIDDEWNLLDTYVKGVKQDIQ